MASTPYTKPDGTDPFLRLVEHRGFACSATMTIPTDGADVVTAGAQPSPPLAGIWPPDSNGMRGRFSSAGGANLVFFRGWAGRGAPILTFRLSTPLSPPE